MPVANRWKLVFLSISLSGGWVSGNQSVTSSKKQEPLSELARKTSQRRSNRKKPVRIITDADLPSINSNVSTSSTSQDVPVTEGVRKTGPEKETEASAPADNEFTALGGQFEEARRNLLIATNEAAVLQLRMNHLRNEFFTRSDGATQERIRYQFLDTKRQIEENKLALARARSIIRGLQQKARKAGIPKRQIQELTGKLPDEPPEIATPESGGEPRES